MKKALLLLIFIGLTSFGNIAENVFICNSKSAAKYHYSPTCRGLNACKHEIIKITLEDAQARGFGLCGWED